MANTAYPLYSHPTNSGLALFLDADTCKVGILQVTSFTLGSVVFASTSGLLAQDNANLFWDATNKRLGIGTSAAPTATLHVIQPVITTGSPVAFQLTAGAHTTLTAGAEAPDVSFGIGRTVQFNTGAIAAQRAIAVGQPTYGFVGASTITDASVLSLNGSPAAGTNATITNSHGIRIIAGAVGSGVTNSYGLTANAQTGGTSNNAAQIVGASGTGAVLLVSQTAATATGAIRGIVYTGSVNTNQTLSTEIRSLTLTTAGRQWATGALSTQREAYVTQPTYSFVGASTITTAATFAIAGAPKSSTNATLTATHGLLIEAGDVSGGTVTAAYGLTVNTPLNGTANYAAQFLGGNVGIGTSSPSSLLHLASSATGTNIAIEQASADSNAPYLVCKKARGTITSPTIVTTGDFLGAFSAQGYDGNNYYTTGMIRVSAEGTVASTRVPGNLTFWTGTDAAPTVLTERMRITSGGTVGISTVTPGVNTNYRLHVYGASAAAVLAEIFFSGDTNVVRGPLSLKHTTDGDMVDAFGVAFNFRIQDSAVVDNFIGAVGAVRAGADNTGDIVFWPAVAGTSTERMRVTSAGNVGIGVPNSVSGGTQTINTSYLLHAYGVSKAAGLFEIFFAGDTNNLRGPLNVKHKSDQNMADGFGASINYRIEDDTSGEKYIGGLSFMRANGDDGTGDFVIACAAAGTSYERIRVKYDGKVGIGLTGPTAILHLLAGTATANTAPLKFTSGTLLSAAEAGAIEFNNDTFYGTTTTGPTRKAFVFADRSISTSTGLSGGGDLSANRTLTVDQTFSPTWSGLHTFSNDINFGSGAARTLKITANDSKYSLSILGGGETTPGTGTGDVLLDAGASTGTAGKLKLGATNASEVWIATNKLAFFGVTAVTRAGAYTQTYATAARTVNPSSTSAFSGIDNAQGGSVYAQLADLNTLRTDLLAAIQNVNALIDDLQAYGLAQ
jgi:hypothetical protein